MHCRPSIYVDFYSRYIANGTRVTRMGGGALDDVLPYICKPGICVISSLISESDCPTVKLGRAKIDPNQGLVPLPLPPLDANGVPAWLFWEGASISAYAAAFLQSSLPRSPAAAVSWLHMKRPSLCELLGEKAIQHRLEDAWTRKWPDGPVFVRYEGTLDQLEHWAELPTVPSGRFT